MKTILVSGVVFCCLALVYPTTATCTYEGEKITYPEKFVTMNSDYNASLANCTTLMKKQIQTELHASLVYLYMAAKFSEDEVNRPGMAKMFFESANEEREHAIKFIEYLLMRGQLDSIKDLISFPTVPNERYDSLEALKAALNLEVSVTSSITNIIKACEAGKNNDNDYHLVDYLTAVFLDEQFKGQRHLAGLISVLGKMKTSMGDLGEFLFDKKLLNGELPAVG